MAADTESLVVTYDEACQLMSISRATLQRMLARGDLQRVVIGQNCSRIRRADIMRLVNSPEPPSNEWMNPY